MSDKAKSIRDSMDSLHKAAQGFFLQTEVLPLLSALDRILAEEVYVEKSLPSFDNSAMDGYALKTSDAGKTLKIQKTIFAGDCAEAALGDLECVKIMTGAKIPNGADCVVPFEEIEGGFQNTKQILAPQNLKKGANIRKCGEEITKGARLLEKGDDLNADCLTLLATQGISYLKTFVPLKISIFASGDELQEIWEQSDSARIFNSNATMIAAILKSYGFKSSYGGILADNRQAIKEALGIPSDVIFTSGGASKGEADFMREVLKECGAQMVIDGVQIKPGKPLMVAKLDSKFIVALPGNPLAGAVLLRLLIVPFLRQLSGANAYYPQFIMLKVAQDLKRKTRTEASLVKIQEDCVHFVKDGKYGSGEVTPMALGNALVIFGETCDSITKGQWLKVLPYKMDFGVKEADFIN
ncbi:molybdopterin molybdotransferase MoeA [Helicobacter sp. MIT 05-5294]|uniref:molybdopterin molybdotransferase MoeA n=1 Tax=Helicobacter sp. MIT 05-5294 TaxID=1548150 RepID=UPI0010FD92FD|nr:molybdopterin molybdotransferase MoeA [Helicobacter sp. MIT 05-5294]TLD87269.1 molybdopterin molybdenumtransferase MoeA [Helicobacter sp. MIT 05-5294]